MFDKVTDMAMNKMILDRYSSSQWGYIYMAFKTASRKSNVASSSSQSGTFRVFFLKSLRVFYKVILLDNIF